MRHGIDGCHVLFAFPIEGTEETKLWWDATSIHLNTRARYEVLLNSDISLRDSLISNPKTTNNMDVLIIDHVDVGITRQLAHTSLDIAYLLDTLQGSCPYVSKIIQLPLNHLEEINWLPSNIEFRASLYVQPDSKANSQPNTLLNFASKSQAIKKGTTQFSFSKAKRTLSFRDQSISLHNGSLENIGNCKTQRKRAVSAKALVERPGELINIVLSSLPHNQDFRSDFGILLSFCLIEKPNSVSSLQVSKLLKAGCIEGSPFHFSARLELGRRQIESTQVELSLWFVPCVSIYQEETTLNPSRISSFGFRMSKILISLLPLKLNKLSSCKSQYRWNLSRSDESLKDINSDIVDVNIDLIELSQDIKYQHSVDEKDANNIPSVQHTIHPNQIPIAEFSKTEEFKHLFETNTDDSTNQAFNMKSNSCSSEADKTLSVTPDQDDYKKDYLEKNYLSSSSIESSTSESPKVIFLKTPAAVTTNFKPTLLSSKMRIKRTPKSNPLPICDKKSLTFQYRDLLCDQFSSYSFPRPCRYLNRDVFHQKIKYRKLCIKPNQTESNCKLNTLQEPDRQSFRLNKTLESLSAEGTTKTSGSVDLNASKTLFSRSDRSVNNDLLQHFDAEVEFTDEESLIRREYKDNNSVSPSTSSYETETITKHKCRKESTILQDHEVIAKKEPLLEEIPQVTETNKPSPQLNEIYFNEEYIDERSTHSFAKSASSSESVYSKSFEQDCKAEVYCTLNDQVCKNEMNPSKSTETESKSPVETETDRIAQIMGCYFHSGSDSESSLSII